MNHTFVIIAQAIGIIAGLCLFVFCAVFTMVYAIDLAKLIDHRRWNSCRCPTCGNIKNESLCDEIKQRQEARNPVIREYPS